MDVLQKKIDNSDNLSLFEYNNILKLCADFYEMEAMVYIYDKMLENNIKPNNYTFKQIGKLHSKKIKESSLINIHLDSKKRLEPRRRIHKIMKGFEYSAKYNNALQHKDKVINYLNNQKSIDLDNRISLAKLISKNVNISFNDARYIITYLKRTQYFNKNQKNLKQNTILKYFTVNST